MGARNLRPAVDVRNGMSFPHSLPIRIMAIALLVGGCALPGGGSGTPTSAPTPLASLAVSPMPSTPPQTFATYPAASSSAVPVSTVTSPSQAAAVVFASNPLFSSILPESTDSNQPATSYTASEAATGYVVSVTIGQHTWNYSVGTDGKVTLVSQQGAAPQATPDAGTSDPATVVVALVAGPVCPVERNPPDPNCAARPVPNASVILRDATGQEVRSGTADAAGTVTFTVPGGAYYVEPAPVGGLMRAPSPTAFSVPGGRDAKVTLTYDTGIR